MTLLDRVRVPQEVLARHVGEETVMLHLANGTYYSLDPVLDRIFGTRPADYLATLGKVLDKDIEVFWTGEKVCSESYSLEHIEAIGQLLGRKPFLWDNYPVNDGPRMCKYLHLRPFTGRPAGLARLLSGHAANPMNQPELSKIPLLTLSGRMDRKSFLDDDIPLFQDKGLDGLSGEEKAALIEKYSAIEDPGALELIDWLRGGYAVTGFS